MRKAKNFGMAFKIIAAMALAVSVLQAQIVEPVNPAADDVFFQPAEEPEKKEPAAEEPTLPAALTFASGDRLSGRLILQNPKFTIPANESISGRVITIAYADVLEINALLWKGKDTGNGGYYFTPYLVSVKMKNGEVYRCAQMMDKIDFIDQQGRRNLFFTGFYDYLKNGKWANSGSTEKTYPTKNPHPKTATGIIFEKTQSGFDIRKMLQ
jgi:hypothetical protein